MKTKAIAAAAAVIVIWMLVVGVGIAVSFDEVVDRARGMAKQEWSFAANAVYGGYEDIKEIEGSRYFIGINDIEYHLIDETGRSIAGPYSSMEAIGDGFVRTESTPTGAVIEDEDGDNIRTLVGVLDKNGYQLSEEKAAAVLYEYADGGNEEDSEPGGGEREYREYKVVRYGNIIGIAKAGE